MRQKPYIGLNRKTLDKVAEMTAMQPEAIRLLAQAIFMTILEQLNNHETVNVEGFGRFTMDTWNKRVYDFQAKQFYRKTLPHIRFLSCARVASKLAKQPHPEAV